MFQSALIAAFFLTDVDNDRIRQVEMFQSALIAAFFLTQKNLAEVLAKKFQSALIAAFFLTVVPVSLSKLKLTSPLCRTLSRSTTGCHHLSRFCNIKSIASVDANPNVLFLPSAVVYLL